MYKKSSNGLVEPEDIGQFRYLQERRRTKKQAEETACIRKELDEIRELLKYGQTSK